MKAIAGSLNFIWIGLLIAVVLYLPTFAELLYFAIARNI